MWIKVAVCASLCVCQERSWKRQEQSFLWFWKMLHSDTRQVQGYVMFDYLNVSVSIFINWKKIIWLWKFNDKRILPWTMILLYFYGRYIWLAAKTSAWNWWIISSQLKSVVRRLLFIYMIIKFDLPKNDIFLRFHKNESYFFYILYIINYRKKELNILSSFFTCVHVLIP